MTTAIKEPAIIPQNPQMDIFPVVINDSIPNIWRTTRPINARTAVRNVYLDSATLSSQKSIAASWTSGIDWSPEYTWVGNYDFILSTNDWFTIPTDWTYTISMSSFILWFTAPTEWLVIIIWTHYRTNIINSPTTSAPYQACDWDWATMTYTYNFNKWDIFYFTAINSTNQTLTIRILATITKLS